MMPIFKRPILSIKAYTLLNEFGRNPFFLKPYTSFKCSFCGHKGAFFSFGDPLRPNAFCRHCGSLERHRLLWLYLVEYVFDISPKVLNLLHFAPEECLRQKLQEHPRFNYQTADINPIDVDYSVNMMDLSFVDNSYDLIICNHILEHVEDDNQALKELYRVLSEKGAVLITVPLDYSLKETYENSEIILPEERKKHFGQFDHVRQYGQDFPLRLEQAGFNVRSWQPESCDKLIQTALNPNEWLYIAFKK